MIAKLDWAKRWLSENLARHHNGTRVHRAVNPANGESLGDIPEAGATEVDAAVDAARAAFRASTLTRRERAATLQKIGALIREHREELATLESLDNGKTFREAYNDDLPESADVFDYYAGWTDKYYGESVPLDGGFVNYTRREPLGVCALIVPWNFPLLLACWKIAPALAMGNTVVVKPSPFTSHSLLRLKEILDEAKVLQPGVFNVVLGGAEAGRLLSEHPRVDKVSFTGSTEIGKAVVRGAASNLKSVSLELGGKSPDIFFEDTPDPKAAFERAFNALFSHKGEKCSEPTRFFVHEKLYGRFVETLVPLCERVVCGDPFDKATHQGPQCHEAHMEKVLRYIEAGKADGAKLLAGGKRDTSGTNAKGFFVRPTLFGDVTPKMSIATDEIFGPVGVVIRFRDEDEVIAMANDTIYGLAAGLYTADTARAHRVAARLDAGMVWVNHYGCYDFASPFGGVKQSGWGREMAIHSLDAYTRLKSVWIKY